MRLGWIHAERPFRRLVPPGPVQRQAQARVLVELWQYYRALKAYQQWRSKRKASRGHLQRVGTSMPGPLCQSEEDLREMPYHDELNAARKAERDRATFGAAWRVDAGTGPAGHEAGIFMNV